MMPSGGLDMNTNKAAVKVRITAVILMVSCLFSLSSCYKEPVIEKSNSNSEINEYIEELVGIDLSPYMAESEMEVEKGNDEFAYIKIHLVYKTEAKVTEILKKETRIDDNPVIKIPAFKNHPYAIELKKMDLTGHYIQVKEGKLLSRDINIYTTRNPDNHNDRYVFIFG